MPTKATDVSAEMVSFVSKVYNLYLYCKDVGSTDYATDFWQENIFFSQKITISQSCFVFV
jgi:hypothetical protein